ncbi:unnamed protein product [Didymodactylos carnosus]|uniref:Uncharacterized protein n=1 Tax=Didymodactylos carnosus TaxID=1234261 RepID=A0A8S2CLS0_9BILA|nr:unnamed protein product [Didymodactylos carnosus]CAF3519969.1 unnamed protein product [Didymodactylos carnosus]
MHRCLTDCTITLSFDQVLNIPSKYKHVDSDASRPLQKAVSNAAEDREESLQVKATNYMKNETPNTRLPRQVKTAATTTPKKTVPLKGACQPASALSNIQVSGK